MTSRKKSFSGVSEMVRETADSKNFADDLAKRLAQRQLIKQLTILRAANGMSQVDIAKKLKCTQSRISKLEGSDDGDLRFGDILEYADAIGFGVQMVFFKKDITLSDRIRYHYFQTKQLMERLVLIAEVDDTIAKGVARFFGEACANFFNMLFDKAKALPKKAREEVPLINLVGDDEEVEFPSSSETKSQRAKDHVHF